MGSVISSVLDKANFIQWWIFIFLTHCEWVEPIRSSLYRQSFHTTFVLREFQSRVLLPVYGG